MKSIARLFAAVTLTLALAACATMDRYGAAGDVHALLVAIRDNDRASFDAHVDRPALKREIEARLMGETRRSDMDPGLRALGALLAQPLADVAGEALIQPGVFRAVAASYGYSPSQALPNPLVIGNSLRAVGDGRVCAPRSKGGPCLLMFSRDNGVWRLSGFEGELSELRTRP
jgi:hypothetical protein